MKSNKGVFWLARTDDLIVEQVGNDVLLYDKKSRQAYCLNQTSAGVWRSCDGETSIADISLRLGQQTKLPIDEDVVRFALRALEKNGLVTAPAAVALPVNIGRRELVRKLGIAAAAVPLVTMLATPTPAKAYGCMLGNTPIAVVGGGFVAARDVCIGTEVLGTDPNSGTPTRGVVEHVLCATSPRFLSLITEHGDLIQCSPSHLLIAGHGDLDGTPVESLKVGDTLLRHLGDRRPAMQTRIAAISVSEIPQPVYNFEIGSSEHTYRANGVVSHNSKIGTFASGHLPSLDALKKV
jgi:hypothetical protein